MKLPRAAIEAMARKRLGAAGFADRAALYGEPTARGAAAIERLAGVKKPAAGEAAGSGASGKLRPYTLKVWKAGVQGRCSKLVKPS